MKTYKQVIQQLRDVGCNFRFWGRPEIRELPNILMNDEIIAKCVNGYYEGGFALLCVTTHRILLVDRKPMLLKVEDIRFEMVVEMDYNALLMTSALKIVTPNKNLNFGTWSQHRLRDILNYSQQRIAEVRQHYMAQQFRPATLTRYVTPVVAGGLALQATSPQAAIGMAPYYGPYLEAPPEAQTDHYPEKY